VAVDHQAPLAAMAGPGEPDAGPAARVIRRCTLFLDVPQTLARAEPFPAWHLAVTQLAIDVDATVIDDQGQPISLAARRLLS
jgi:hypothetical protein